ncbi:MAG: glycosyltransferase family 4 protein [Polaromonas sp.]|nr:glycosyltransferase family 4 protein [Polaromonas sp.]
MYSRKHKILALTQGGHTPSARFRWQQYVGDLVDAGLEVSESTSHFGAYAPASGIRRPAWLAATMVESLVRTLGANRYDLRFLQRNLTATLCTWEPLLRKPFVFDVDDAIFLGPRGASADRIARFASLIICGNNFLANHFSRHGPVVVLPTAVDTSRFVLRAGPPPSRQVIGWSGSSSGLKYLYGIEPAIQKLLHRHPEAMFKVVSDKAPIFKTLPSDRVVYERWSPDREVAALHGFTVGIMPLEDDLWARGKCSFKMLTYMAVGIPVVVSPVGMNSEILAQGPCGFAAKTSDDWVDAISTLLSDTTLACQMGRSGRQIVEARYARNVIAPQLAQLLKEQL